MTTQVRKIYQNEMQSSVNMWRSRKTHVDAGRGTGKSALLSDHEYLCMSSIPGGTDFLLGNSKRQLLSITMPTLIKELTSKWGLVPGRDFTPGRAPMKAGFEMPLYPPQTWSNVIHFRNGFVTAPISAATSSAGNGYNFVSGRIDEAKFIDPQWYSDVMKPAIRGAINNHPGWRRGGPGRIGNPMYTSEWSVSDRGVTANQTRWSNALKAQAENEENLVIREQIAEMLAEFSVAKQEGWAQELINTPGFANKLQELRCQSVSFFNFSTISNIEILAGGGDPESYIKELQRSMAPLLFSIVIMGREVSQKTVDSYYKNFDEDVHTYLPDDDSTEELLTRSAMTRRKGKNPLSGSRFDYETFDIEETTRLSNTCAFDSDMDWEAPLLISFDFNRGVNTMVCSQYRRNFQRWGACLTTLKTFINMNDGVEGLCEDFCKYYVYKMSKEIVLIYDSTANQGANYASRYAEESRFYNICKRTLEDHGWHVTLYPIGQAMDHDLKVEFVNECFAGKRGFMPLINRTNNDLLIASMQNSKVYYGIDGKPRKDKRIEKKKVNSEDEKIRIAATDVTDAYDTTLIGVVKSQGNFAAQRGKWGLPGMRAHRLRTSR